MERKLIIKSTIRRLTIRQSRDLPLALQFSVVEFVRNLPTLDRHASVAGKEVSVKVIEIGGRK
jgi:hypothetical protein